MFQRVWEHVLVLILTPGSCPRGEREEGVRGKKLRAHMTEEAWSSGLAEREGVQGDRKERRRDIFFMRAYGDGGGIDI
jgi:hypothetical protein